MCKKWPGPRCSGHSYKKVLKAQESLDSREAMLKSSGETDFSRDETWRKRKANLLDRQAKYFCTPAGIRDLREWAAQEKDPHKAAIANRLANENAERRDRQVWAEKAGLTAVLTAEDRRKLTQYIGSVDMHSGEAAEVTQSVMGFATDRHQDGSLQEGDGHDVDDMGQPYLKGDGTVLPADPRSREKLAWYDASGLSPQVKERMRMALDSTSATLKQIEEINYDLRHGNVEGNVLLRPLRYRALQAKRDQCYEELSKKVKWLQGTTEKIPASHGMTAYIRTDWKLRLLTLGHLKEGTRNHIPGYNDPERRGQYDEMHAIIERIRGQIDGKKQGWGVDW